MTGSDPRSPSRANALFQEGQAYDCVVPDDRQLALTKRWLTPDLDNLCAGILSIRAQVDAHFERLKIQRTQERGAHLAGLTDVRSYPYGYCEVIRDTVWNSMQHSLAQPGAGRGHFLALREFLRAGGMFRKIWGELTHGPYLQNAMQIGAYYVDPANDTVVVSKPKLEVKLLFETNFRNIDGFEQYFDIVHAYYQWDTYPNRQFVELAPLFPGIAVHRQAGVLVICDIPKPLVYKNLQQGGALAQRFLSQSSYAAKHLPDVHDEVLRRFQHRALPDLMRNGRLDDTPVLRSMMRSNAPTDLSQTFRRLHAWLAQLHSAARLARELAHIDRSRKQIDRALREYSSSSGAGGLPTVSSQSTIA